MFFVVINSFCLHLGGYPANPGPTPADPQGLSKKDCLVIEGFSQVLCFAFRSDTVDLRSVLR